MKGVLADSRWAYPPWKLRRKTMVARSTLVSVLRYIDTSKLDAAEMAELRVYLLEISRTTDALLRGLGGTVEDLERRDGVT